MKFLFSLIVTMVLLSPICTYGQTTKVGDINGDGKVTVSDLLALSQLILNDEEDENQPSAEAGEAIDLGLPSGIKWASCNVGATKPEEYGGYYAWGETEEKDVYDWSTYIHCDGSPSSCHNLGYNISGTEYDVAHVKWGDNWRIPTKDEFTELYNNCTCDSTTLNGVHGMILTSNINGNSIFLPGAGSKPRYSDLIGFGEYLLSTQSTARNYSSFGFYFHKYSNSIGSTDSIYIYRCEGRSVRPVTDTTNSANNDNANNAVCDINGDSNVSVSDILALVQIILNEEENEGNPTEEAGEAIDLGLPSGTKWASYNVGATKPEEYGGYYAWGETEEKEIYNWSTYIHCDGSEATCHDIGNDISGTEYDVAHVKWGGTWRMPMIDEIGELIENCTLEQTTYNDIDGYKFTGSNGNSIFLPAAGESGSSGFSIYAFIWSSMIDSSRSNNAWSLLVYDNKAIKYNIYGQRFRGRSIRPVTK